MEVMSSSTTHTENNKNQKLWLVTYDTAVHLLSYPDEFEAPLHCVLCNVTTQDASTASNHIRGRKHHEVLSAEITKREAEEDRAAGLYRPTRANLPAHGDLESRGRGAIFGGRRGGGRLQNGSPTQWGCVNGQCRKYFSCQSGADRAICPFCSLDQSIRW